MKGARRTRKNRQQAGFADLMAPSHPTTSMRGVVTGVSRAQPTTPTSNPTTPPPLDEDWGALLQTTPKRKMSPQRPIVTTTPNSSPSTNLSPTTTERHNFSPNPTNTPSTSTPVPAFLSGWDGADGWGDDPSLDDSDQDIQEDAWGVWPESHDILSSRSELTSHPVSTDRPDPPNSLQRPAQHLSDTAPNNTMHGEFSAVSLNSFPVPPVEENLALPQKPQLATSTGMHRETAGAEALEGDAVEADAEEHHGAQAGDGGVICPSPTIEGSSQSMANDIFSEDETLQPSISVPCDVPQQQSEEPLPPETIGAEDSSELRLKLNFSGWNEGQVADVEGNAALFPIPQSEDTQSRQSTTTEETKQQLECRTEEQIPFDEVGEQVATHLQMEADDGGAEVKEVGETNAETYSNPTASAASSVVTSDNRHEAPALPLSMSSWGFEETDKEVQADKDGWGWGETDNTVTSNINHSEDTLTIDDKNAALKPSDFASESLKGNCWAANSATDERIGEEVIKSEEPHPTELQESRRESENADLFSSSQPIASPEGGWDFAEDSRETVTDDWGWGAKTHNDFEFTVDTSANNAKTPPSVSAEDPSLRGPAYAAHHSHQETDHQSTTGLGSQEEDGMTVRPGTVAEVMDQKLQSAKSAADDQFQEEPMSSGPDDGKFSGVNQSQGTTLEANDSFPLVGDSAQTEYVHEHGTLDRESATSGYSRLPTEERPPNSGSCGPTKTEDDAWAMEIRSTDVDVSSTTAGTDVPSVVGPPSVDESEWDAHGNELRFNAPHAADETQSNEKLNVITPAGTPASIWSVHDHTSQKDRSWTDPDALWSSDHADCKSRAALETPSGTVDQSAAAEAESEANETIPLKNSDSTNVTALGSPKEPSFGTVKGSSASENIPSYPTIDPNMFRHFPGNNPEAILVRKSELNQQVEIHAVAEPARLGSAEARNNSADLWVTLSERQDHIQPVPQQRSSAVSDIASSVPPTDGKNSNSYWTERLDQSNSRKPDDSRYTSHIASTNRPGADSAEAEIETSLASGVELELPSDSMPEKDAVNIPLNTKLDASNQPIKQSFPITSGPSKAASGPSTCLGAQPFSDPVSQLGPTQEAKFSTNRNETMNLVAPAVGADEFFHSLERGSGATDTRAQNGPTASESSRSFEDTQSSQWPSQRFPVDVGDGSNYFTSLEDRHNMQDSSNIQPDRRDNQADNVLSASRNNSLPVYNKFVSHLTSSPAEGSIAELSSEGIHPRPDQPLSDVPQANVSGTEATPHDMVSYDPFSVSHDDPMLKQTNAGEAFDWNFGAAEPMRGGQGPLPSISEEPQTENPQTGIRSPTTLPQTNENKETKTGRNATQKKTMVEKEYNLSATLNFSQGSYASCAVEAVGSLTKEVAGRKVAPSEEEKPPVSPHWEARNLEHGVEDLGARTYQTVESSQDGPPASDPEQYLGDASGFERYAPRLRLSADSGDGVPSEDPSSSVGRERLGTSGTNENIINVPFTAASSGISLSDTPVPEKDPMPVSYQSAIPESSSQFEADVLQAPLPRRTTISGNRRDMRSHQRETESLSPYYGRDASLTPKDTHADHLARSGLSPSAMQCPETHRGGPQAPIPNTIKPERDDFSGSLVSYQGDHGVHGTNAIAYAPVQKESHRQISQESNPEYAESEQHLLSAYNTEVNSSNLLESKPSETSAQFVKQAAYGSVTSTDRPGEDDVPQSKNTVTEDHGPYSIAAEFSLGCVVASPPQQAPFLPAVTQHNQEGIPAESMVDPSAFSYPYSILDTETSGDESYRPQRPLISWGFGGALVTVIPLQSAIGADNGVRTETSVSSTVHIHDLTAISQDGSNDDWAAASEAVSPLPFPVRPPDLLSYANMCDRVSKLSAGLTGSESEGRAAMWRILALLCRQGTSDWRANASTAICGPSSVPMFGRKNGSSFISGKSKFENPLRETALASPTSEHDKNEAAAEVERLLSVGRGMEAIRVATEAGLWSIALILASTIDKPVYKRVVSEYANSVLEDGSAIQILCLSTAEDESEILRRATSSSGLKEWRKTVGMLLTTCYSSLGSGEGHHTRFLRLIDKIGEALMSQKNDVLAGHVCFLLSGRLGPLDSSNIPLLGADPKKPAGRPRSMGSPAAVLQSLVLEAVANAQNGATYPHILPFRLLLAEEVCSVGRPDVALAHCASISSAVRDMFESGSRDISTKCFTLPFLSRLESLEQRLHVHLGLQGSQAKKGRGLSSLGNSLSSVFTRSSTAHSKSDQATPRENIERSAPFVGSQRTPPIQPVSFAFASPQTPAFTSASPQTPAVSSVNVPRSTTESQWTPRFEPSRLHPLPVDKYPQGVQPDAQGGDAKGNERWNSLVSKTIGFIAPAEGDLSPPLKARGDQVFPLQAQPTPLGLGTGTGRRAPSQDVHHMRSASLGDVPMMNSHGPITQAQGQAGFAHHDPEGSPQSQRRNPRADDVDRVNQATFNGMPVQKATITESGAVGTHRRSASDMTFESQTSEKKPPRPPRKSPGLPPGIELQPKKQNAPVVKGWRSRLSEKIRAAFSGPPRAHMGVENKFRYDKERGRWIMEGEDPTEDDDIPPPPPDDDALAGKKQKVPFSQSYESLPNPDLSDQLMPHSNGAYCEGADSFLGGAAGVDNSRRNTNTQFSYNGSTENVNSRDTGSESSVASAASAPVPYSSQPSFSMSANSGNKFRAHPGRLSGRRAYVDTFNKGTPMSSRSAALPRVSRPGIPSVPVLGSSNGNGYRIFTPSPGVSSELEDQNQHGSGRALSPGTSGSTVESNDQMYQLRQETTANNMQKPGDSLGYGLPQPAPTPSVEQYQANTRNENQPRLMA